MRNRMNRMLLQILLICALAVPCSMHSCWHNHDCDDKDCQFGSHCVSQPGHHGYCDCAECRHAGDCPSCTHIHTHRTHRYCSGNGYCHCVECLSDSHCHCNTSQIAKCNYHDHHSHCMCQDITTTHQPLVKLECSHRKISVIESIAENLHVEDSRAELCPGTTKHQTSEALVIKKCNSTARSFWSKGEQVKTECSNDAFSPYTPISTFYDQGNNMAAFLIDCTKTTDGVVIGLTIAVQTCNDTPMVMNLNETTTPRMSDFYTILQQM